MTPEESKAKLKRNRDNWKRRALAAEQRLAESDALIKQVQREWLGGKYGVMQFCDGVSARINDAEKLLDEWREMAKVMIDWFDKTIYRNPAREKYRALIEREKESA